MNRKDIKKWIEGWEGRKKQAYMDSERHPTIGVGFNLDKAGARQKIEALSLDYDKVRAGQVNLSDEQIDRLFDADVEQAITDARSIVANFDTIPENKQKVVVDMVFNLGAQGFADFRKTIKAIEKEDWQTAAQEMKDSRWYGQVGRRAVADVEAMGRRVESVKRAATAPKPKPKSAPKKRLRESINVPEGEKIAKTAEATAQDYLERGVKYREGGNASDGGTFSDCSHFVHDVLRQAGYDIPYTATSDMANSKHFSVILASGARVGDIMVQGGHMGIFQGIYKGGCPVGTQMGKSGPKDGKWGPEGWFEDPEDLRFYRVNA